LEASLLALIDEFDLADTVMQAGFEYSVGLRGGRLTPEQRQKLDLARTLLSNPDLAVLHGATSHVSEESEPEIMSRLVAAIHGHSFIWILDRPSLTRYFDLVIVFAGGRLVEQGRYSDLECTGTRLHALLANGREALGPGDSGAHA
jgi:ABC-type bacteriocin/lantibiotic exporter with double-glycine peptidase domain